MSKYRAEKQHRAKVQCPMCGQKREVGLHYARKIWRGEKSDVCLPCSQRNKLEITLRPGEVRIKGKNNKWTILTPITCPTCGSIRMGSRHEVRRNHCNLCKGAKQRVKTREWPNGQPHPVYVKPRGNKISYRCHGLWTMCPRYDECLDAVIELEWGHWICSEPGPKYYEPVSTRLEMLDMIRWYDSQEEYDPMGNHCGINTSRAGSTKY